MSDATVLLVEAEILARGPLAEYLRSCGYNVIEVTGGDEARRSRHRRGNRPDRGA
jgi:DNA-binding response OmpR family regulator